MRAEHTARVPSDLLAIYLRDHHAGATAGIEVARRSARANGGSELGAFLDRFGSEIEEDRRELERIMRELGVKPSRGKDTAAFVAVKAGWLKLNGRLREYSPLSRVLELEGLVIGVTGKLALWRTLEECGRLDASWTPVLRRLHERGESQRAELERQRAAAALTAFG
jgi:hypothetical protein